MMTGSIYLEIFFMVLAIMLGFAMGKSICKDNNGGEIMKCLCGYERLYDYQTDDDIEVGDESFIKILCFGKPFETDKEKEGSYGYEKEEGRLYACPKCMTVKLDFI